MPDYNILSLDESGKASYNHKSGLFILSGIVIPEKFKKKLGSSVKRLKRKFFQDEEIILHCRDILRKKAQFALLKDTEIEIEFWSNLISIINNTKISLLFCISNKENAKNKGWTSDTILKRSYLKILELFAVEKLSTRTKGKIIVESEAHQDLLLIKAHKHLQCNGTSNKALSAYDYSRTITSLCLVNKSNLDIDVQIADTLALLAELKYNLDILKAQKEETKIEGIKKRFIDRKLLNKTNPSFLEIII